MNIISVILSVIASILTSLTLLEPISYKKFLNRFVKEFPNRFTIKLTEEEKLEFLTKFLDGVNTRKRYKIHLEDIANIALNETIKLIEKSEKRIRDRENARVEIYYKFKEMTVVGLIAKDKFKNNLICYSLLSVTFIAHLCLAAVLKFKVDNLLLCIIVISFFLIFLHEQILKIRISNNLYGTNEAEAREILYFLTNNSCNNKFPGGTMNVFPSQEDYIEIYNELKMPGLEGVIHGQ